MSTLHPEQHTSAGRAPDQAPDGIRWRLWAAMLTLALVPTMAGIYLTTSLLDAPPSAISVEQASETSQAAAAMLAREHAIADRLLLAAADPMMGKLANGIAGAAEVDLAEQVMSELRGHDAGVVVSACVVRAADGRRTALPPPPAGGPDPAACNDKGLVNRALGAAPDTVARGTAGSGSARRLLIASPLRSVNERNHGVLSLEVDAAALFDRTRPLAGGSVSSMLVDMGTSEVIAAAPATAGPAEGEGAAPAALLDHLDGILAGDDDAERQLAAMGFTSTLVPVWEDGRGSAIGLVQLWPHQPAGMPVGVSLALLVMLSGAIVAVIVLVRYFHSTYRRMAESQVELQLLYHEAKDDALADSLTGLGNHRAFQESLARAVEGYERHGTSFSLVLLDLDDLKVVNDREGHAAGDDMLRAMARTMRELCRPFDELYRTGGDEFAMVLPNTRTEDATEVTERILYFSKRPADGGRPMTFSAGISGVPWFTRRRDLVYRQADAALYWVKRHGRGSVEVFEPERDQLPEDTGDVTAKAVQEVISGKLLRPVFQPIVDLRSGRILGFEGLIRPDPDGPLPDTARLFAAAAATGRTVELDLACIEAVVQGARAISPDRLLTLNLSPRTLEVKDFDAAWLLQGLVRNGISPSRVIIELTEREEVDDLVHLQRTFAGLQQYGLRLAADDVGAGNSGLRLLSQVQFDIVKIDLSLVHEGVRRLGSRAVLRSLRDLALSQQARIVAEGVETAAQLQVIRELDIGAGQGYLLGRPDASVDLAFVDMQRLESGVLVPEQVPLTPAGLAAAVRPDELDELPPERRAIFLPPAPHPLIGARPGPA